MKKIISLVLTLVMVFSVTCLAVDADKSDFGAYKSVVIVGVDGAGAFFDNTDTPNCDRIFAENAFVANCAVAESKTVSAQNWSSILMGVSYKVHGITNDNIDDPAHIGTCEYPTVFKLAREKYPNAELASICKWNPINIGIIEDDIGVYKDTGTDSEVCEKVVDYISHNDPTLLFVQLDDVDSAGHDYGFGSQEFLDCLTLTDGYIGRIYSAIEEKGAADDTLFIVVSDHGGIREFLGAPGYHGTKTLGDRLVFVGVKGKTVSENQTCGVRNRDVAAITLHALGIDATEDMTSKIPNGLFESSNKVNVFDKIGNFFERALTAGLNLFADTVVELGLF